VARPASGSSPAPADGGAGGRGEHDPGPPGAVTTLGTTAWNVTRGRAIADRLELGESFWARFKGLMGRAQLPDGAGLWLPGSPSIHMLFMRFPIDCVFLGRPDVDGNRPVVGLRRALRPWTGVVWWVRGGQGVVELPVGAIERSATEVGDLVSIGD
jgi:uncharacterized membrane protein (UPF0127 family)